MIPPASRRVLSAELGKRIGQAGPLASGQVVHLRHLARPAGYIVYLRRFWNTIGARLDEASTLGQLAPFDGCETELLHELRHAGARIFVIAGETNTARRPTSSGTGAARTLDARGQGAEPGAVGGDLCDPAARSGDRHARVRPFRLSTGVHASGKSLARPRQANRRGSQWFSRSGQKPSPRPRTGTFDSARPDVSHAARCPRLEGLSATACERAAARVPWDDCRVRHYPFVRLV